MPPELEPGRPFAWQRRSADRGQGHDPARVPRSRRRAPDPGDAHAVVYKGRQKPCAASPKDTRATGFAACKEGPNGVPPCSTFEYGGALTEMVLLGVLAIRMKDQRLEWDSKNLRFTNNEKANELLRIQYRDGWAL